ncbi:MAG: prolyl oligopeptidase family serine peptidase [Anaerolineae bacterium]|nr:prolyl oligopeptidase family serine peptidase [Anaerolineae bacterium]
MQQPHTLTSKFTQRPILNYLLYLPPEYDANDTSKRWPLILFLHGFGERGDNVSDLNILNVTGLPQSLEQGKDIPFIVVSPQCPRYSWWTLHTGALKSLTETIIADYPVDPSRVYLTGLSMGGYGSWTLGASYPELFAAVAPICGGGVASEVAGLKDVPVWAFHGELDDVVPPHCSRDMVAALQKAGGDVKLTLYPDLQHNSWTATYDNPELYDWFLSHQKPSS